MIVTSNHTISGIFMAKAAKASGQERFDQYYGEIYGNRWPVLREALLKETNPVSLSDKLTEPYYMDKASIFPFKPYKPLNQIDYSLNWSLGQDTSSIAYKPESLTQRSLLPMGFLATGILYNDNILDKHIVKLGSIASPRLGVANILQYSPAGILYAMKIAGVEGRSDWPRMITADGASIVLMTVMTNVVKHTVKRERPDGRAFNSFPSGHTATVFMCAQMLHKEYGETLSPWISVGGYGIAATTGIFRVISNRHWCSDVMGGAALGIFSTELGYELTDILFGEQGLRKPLVVPDIEDMPQVT